MNKTKILWITALILLVVISVLSGMQNTTTTKQIYKESSAVAVPLQQTFYLSQESYIHSYQCKPVSGNSYYCPKKEFLEEGELGVVSLQLEADNNGDCKFEYYAKGSSRIWDWDKLSINQKMAKCDFVGNKGCSINYEGNYNYCILSWYFTPNCEDKFIDIQIYKDGKTVDYSIPTSILPICGDGVCSSCETCDIDCDFKPLKELNVELYPQITSKTCGPAVLQSILKFFNKEVPPQESVSDEVNGWDGTEPSDFVYYLNKNGINAVFTKQMTISKIISEIDNQRIVIPIIYIYNQYQYQRISKEILSYPRETHYVLIYGYDNNHLYALDPLNGKRVYTFDAFKKLQYNNMGVLLE